jgi:hypothetical protein
VPRWRHRAYLFTPRIVLQQLPLPGCPVTLSILIVTVFSSLVTLADLQLCCPLVRTPTARGPAGMAQVQPATRAMQRRSTNDSTCHAHHGALTLQWLFGADFVTKHLRHKKADTI